MTRARASTKRKTSSIAVMEFRRSEIEHRIEELIALLDLLDGDENLEDGADDEPSIGNVGRYVNHELHYDLEADSADEEPSLGWANPEGLRAHVPEEARRMMSGFDDAGEGIALSGFNGDGQHIGRKLLRDNIKDHRKLARAMDATRVSPGYGRYV